MMIFLLRPRFRGSMPLELDLGVSCRMVATRSPLSGSWRFTKEYSLRIHHGLWLPISVRIITLAAVFTASCSSNAGHPIISLVGGERTRPAEQKHGWCKQARTGCYKWQFLLEVKRTRESERERERHVGEKMVENGVLVS